MKTKEQIQLKREQAWRRGVLRWKLRKHQQKVYDQIKEVTAASFYFNKARRIGGSYLLCVLAVQCCLRIPGAQVKYAAPTAKNVRKIINPSIRKIIKDCPDDLRPKFVILEGEWQFPNGSSIAVAGCDGGQAQNLRGTESHFICLDQVGFIDDLEYILNDILAPQVKQTSGTIVLTSTPARSPAHESFKMAMAHQEAGRYSHVTVWQDEHLTREQHQKYFQKQAQGKGMSLQEYYNSTTFRRQYLGQFVTDEERAVVPEWNIAIQNHITNINDPRFKQSQFVDRYVSVDIGWRDGMGILFGYWDFKKAALVIVDEILLFKKTSQQTIEAVHTKEIQTWPGQKIFLRISDNDLQTIADFNQAGAKYGITFIPTKKDDKQLQVNRLREWIKGYKVFIHPRCKRLLSQLKSTVWNTNRTSFERNKEGHGDLLDALIYLVRNVRVYRNPEPEGYGIPNGFEWVVPEQSFKSNKNAAVLEDYFGTYSSTFGENND